MPGPANDMAPPPVLKYNIGSVLIQSEEPVTSGEVKVQLTKVEFTTVLFPPANNMAPPHAPLFEGAEECKLINLQFETTLLLPPRMS